MSSTLPLAVPGVPSVPFFGLRSGRLSPVAVFATLAIFLVTLNFPAVPVAGLDQTWQLLLARAWEQNWRFGHDVVFTYGPLGMFENRHQLPELYWSQIGWQVLSRLAGAVLIVRLLLRLPRWQLAIAIGLTALRISRPAGANTPDFYQLLVIFAAGLTLLETSGKGWRALALTVLTAFALLKFTLFFAAGFAVGVAVLQQVFRRNPGTALGLGGSFVLGYLVLWKICGQAWQDLPGYLHWSYEVADGYVDGMVLFASWKMYPVIILSAALFAVFAFRVLRLRPDSRETWPVFLLTAGCFYLAWRHGTVRAGPNHLPSLFCAIAVWPWVLLAAARPVRAHPGLTGLACVLGLSLIAPFSSYKDSFAEQAQNLRENITTNVLTLARPFHSHRKWNTSAERSLAVLQEKSPLRLAALRQNTVVYGSNYVDLLVHPGVTPLPNLQAYAAYTPALARLDREALQSLAPDNVLVDLKTTDNRLLTGEHLPLIGELLRNYRWRQKADHYLWFERNPQASGIAPANPEPLAVLPAVRFGERLQLAAFGDTPLQMQADIRPTALGKIIRFFLPLPPLSLEITRDETGNWRTFHRVAWRLAGDGWMIRPFIASNQDFARWLDTGQADPVRTVACQGFAAAGFTANRSQSPSVSSTCPSPNRRPGPDLEGTGATGAQLGRFKSDRSRMNPVRHGHIKHKNRKESGHVHFAPLAAFMPSFQMAKVLPKVL